MLLERGIMILENDLKELLSSRGIRFIKGEKYSGGCIKANCELNEFVSIAKDIIFYNYIFENKTEWIITADVQNSIFNFQSERKYCSKFINEWNAKIENLDFSQPIFLELTTIIDGQIIYWMCEDNWFKIWLTNQNLNVDDITNATRLLKYYIDEKADYIELSDEELYGQDEEEKEKNQRNKELEIELKKRLYADIKFRTATNKELRRSYAITFLQLKSNIKYKPLYINKAGKYWDDEYKCTIMIDEIFAEYKFNCRELGVKVGSEITCE